MRLPTPVHIETICCVDRVKTFTAAALCMHTTQSAISARVRDVETMLGVELFQRNGRQVETTVHGRRFVDTAGALMQRLHDFIGSFGDLSAGGTRLRIAAGNTAMGTLGTLLATLQQRFPLIHYDVETLHAGGILREVDTGRMDLGVLALPPGELDGGRFAYRSLGRETLRWLMSAQHLRRLEEEGATDMQSLLDRCAVWCVPRPTAHFEQAIDSIREGGGEIRHLHTSSNMPATLDIILAGAGIGLVTDTLSRRFRDSGELVPVFEKVELAPLEFFIIGARERQSALLNEIMDAAVQSSTFEVPDI